MGNFPTKKQRIELTDETIEHLAQINNLTKPTIIEWHKQFLFDCPGKYILNIYMPNSKYIFKFFFFCLKMAV